MKRISTFILCCILSLAPMAPARAIEHKSAKIPALPPIVANYDVYVGGLHLIAAHIVFQQDKGTYHTQVQAGTHGFWHDLLPWDVHLDAHGRMVGANFVPAEFASHDEWHKKPKITKLHFGSKGNIEAEFDPPSHDENRETVTPEQKKGSLDPITALLQMLAHIAIQKNCNVTVHVFDGKRRFDVTGIDNGTEDIDEGDYGFYKGTTRTCDASFKMIAGEWKDREPSKFWQKSDNEAGRAPFHVWLAGIGPQKTELPVKLESDSVFGLIVVHLTNWHYAAPDEVKAH
jgi:hypothetical protein